MRGVNFSPSHRPRVWMAALLFTQAHAVSLWMVCFSNVLVAHGLERLIPYAFSCSALAAFISPLIAGSLADQHISANRLLRWFACGTAVSLVLTFAAIEQRLGAAWVLICLQTQALFSAPTFGLATTIVLASLREPAREFGPIRVWATFGWLIAGLLISSLGADTSTMTGFLASGVWAGVAVLTFTLPRVKPPVAGAGRSWRELFGWEALALLRHREHGPVFVTAGLLSIPLAAFYPFAAMHLRELGEKHVAASMSLGQVTEAMVMYALAPLLASIRFKWLLLAGIAFGIVRYGLFALDSRASVLAGVGLHGLCFTLFFIPAQIYVDRRVERHLQARAQGLMTLMVSGFGTLIGSLGCGWWREACAGPGETQWPLFWSVLCAPIAGVIVYFALMFRVPGRLATSGAPVEVSVAPNPTL